MELQQLKLFVTVAEEGHLTRAAERLFTSQPAVSAQLKSLEETLGVTLFDRTPKGMNLTVAGKQLLVQAQATLRAADQMLSKARSMKGEVVGEVAIGINSDFNYLKLPQLVSLMKEAHPGIQLSLINGMSPDILLDVRKGQLDAGFFFGPCELPNLQINLLADIDTAVIIPARWDDNITTMALPELAQQPWIYTTERCPFFRLMQELLHEHHTEISKVALVDTEDAIREFIKFGHGVALLRADDATRAEQEGWGKRWLGKAPKIPLSLALKSQRAQEPALKALLGVMAQLWPALNQAQLAESAG